MKTEGLFLSDVCRNPAAKPKAPAPKPPLELRIMPGRAPEAPPPPLAIPQAEGVSRGG
jgi:hypothetical protein